MPNTELKVVDMPMGTGKTTGMIHLMNRNPFSGGIS